MAVTLETPGTPFTRAASALSRLAPSAFACTTYAAVTCFVSSPLFALVTAWAMIAMKATTATPIMSAADVVAVRPGFRRAFSLASVPGRPAKRRAVPRRP